MTITQYRLIVEYLDIAKAACCRLHTKENERIVEEIRVNVDLALQALEDSRAKKPEASCL